MARHVVIRLQQKQHRASNVFRFAESGDDLSFQEGIVFTTADALLGHAEPWATITPWGQLMGAIIMFGVLGFIPGFVVSWILKKAGLLRIPREVELAGLDYEMHAMAHADDEEVRAALNAAARPTAAE